VPVDTTLRADPGGQVTPEAASVGLVFSGGGSSVPLAKVSEDAALPLQGADYWRRIDAHRRAGHVRAARLFGDAEMSDQPPLVYLVAPLLRFHRSFQTLARCIKPEIEMYRFDLNEDWRAGVRVARRSALT